jgi:hypothetical protein
MPEKITEFLEVVDLGGEDRILVSAKEGASNNSMLELRRNGFTVHDKDYTKVCQPVYQSTCKQ